MLLAVLTVLIISCKPPQESSNSGTLAGEATAIQVSQCTRNAACNTAYTQCLNTVCKPLARDVRAWTACQDTCLRNAQAAQQTTTSTTTPAPTTTPATPPTPTPNTTLLPPSTATMTMPEYTLALDTACRRNQTCQGLYNGCMQATCAILAANSSTSSFVSCRHDCTVSATIGRVFRALPCADAHPNFCTTQDTCTAAGNYWMIGHEELANTYNQCTDTCPYGTVANPDAHLCVIPDGSPCLWVHPERCHSGYCNYYANNMQGACEPTRVCEANWDCTEWSVCHAEANQTSIPNIVDEGTNPETINVRTRTCTDTNLCGWAAAVASRPTETELCSGTA